MNPSGRHRICARPPIRTRHDVTGFSLLEMMVAVTLLAIIIVGLLSMFYQTQRAFRQGSTQSDVLEGGRATMELTVEELQQITPTGQPGEVNLYSSNVFQLIQPRPGGGGNRVNTVQHSFFVTRSNDLWVGTGYLVYAPLGDVGTLYRYVTNAPLTEAARLYWDILYAINSFPTNWGRMTERVVDFQLIPYDTLGLLSSNVVKGSFIYTNNPTDKIPAYVDLELGILEPRAFERYRALTNLNPVSAHAYLEGQVSKVHLFRQRVPIRTAQ